MCSKYLAEQQEQQKQVDAKKSQSDVTVTTATDTGGLVEREVLLLQLLKLV